MNIMDAIAKLFTRHTELGRQHEQLGRSLKDLQKEAAKVQSTVDDALIRLQRFATDVKKSRNTKITPTKIKARARARVRISAKKSRKTS